ncbi:MAG: hydrogenase maturation nickel metallochaperone HypA [Actinomycetota bacterium]|nr:hydrogenase maturation nickel metallochaperone HypA [Actinomycetota bacterium]
MHEYSITSSIIEIVKRNIKEKNLGPIQKINFELSPLSQIEPESVNFYFKALTVEDQYLKDTKLNFIKKKLKLTCRECKKTSETEDFIVKCFFVEAQI